MIKFFSKIRQNSIRENKLTNYLKYAIGEIILVVVGILIALQINNWNESRKQYKTEKEFIASVKNDLRQDKAFINRVIDQTEPRIAAYEVLNRKLPDLYRDDRKALDSVFGIYFKSQRTFYPISGSYESAVSGNQLTTFRNGDLIKKLLSYITPRMTD